MLEIWSDYQTQEEAAEAAKSGAGGGKKKVRVTTSPGGPFSICRSLSGKVGVVHDCVDDLSRVTEQPDEYALPDSPTLHPLHHPQREEGFW